MKHKKNNKDFNKCIDAFFIDEKNNNQNTKINQNKNNDRNEKINIEQKKRNVNYESKEEDDKMTKKRKRFSPLPKEKYRDNNSFQKLLINRLEKQILTDIYDEYNNKEEFDETFYHIENIKNILNQKSIEEAIKCLNSIENVRLREKIIIESTFFFKQIVKEEIEFAENNDGRLILYKQPDYLFNQNSKNTTPLSGRANKKFGYKHRNINYKLGQKRSYYNDDKIEYENEEYNNCSFYSNNFNKNPFMYKSQNNKKYHK
jgi:hypothetical protein